MNSKERRRKVDKKIKRTSTEVGENEGNAAWNVISIIQKEMPHFFWNSFLSLHIFFSIRFLFQRHWRLTGQQGKGGDYFFIPLYHFHRSRTIRHLFATLHVRWLSHILYHTACIYQAATRRDLPPYRIRKFSLHRTWFW